jgi:hypothetical protein
MSTTSDVFMNTASLHFLPKGVETMNTGPFTYEGRFRDPSFPLVSKNQCFEITITDDHMNIDYIKYSNEFNCKLAGSVILRELIEIARKMELNYVELSDFSRIYRPGFISKGDTVSGEERYENSYELAYYRILLEGQSWYNRIGFVSDSTPLEYAHNQQLRNTPFLQLDAMNSVEFMNVRKGRLNKKQTKIAEKIAGPQFAIDREVCIELLKSNGIVVTDTTTVGDIFEKINEKVLQGELADVFDTIIAIMRLMIEYHFIFYIEDGLRLYLHKSDKRTSISKSKTRKRIRSKK